MISKKENMEAKTGFFHIYGIGANDFWISWDKLLFLQTNPNGMLGPYRLEAHLLDGTVIAFSTKDHPDNQRFVEEVIF